VDCIDINAKIVAVIFSVEKKSNVKTDEQKRKALHLYFQRMGFRAI